jgi:hypothetical protein
MKLVLDAVIVAAAAALLVIAGTGGFEIGTGALSVRVRDWVRPAVVLACALAARAALGRASAPRGRASVGAALHGAAVRGLVALTLAAGVTYSQYHVRVAGGLDSYGYVSAATLIASGRLREPQPLAAVLPFADSLSAATPLGQVAAPDGRSSVPRFPLGLPAVMALFAMFHPSGPFFVPLVMAYVALILVYALARGASDEVTGLFAAALVAVDPVFAVSAMQPMSDVPAACWLLAAVWAAQTEDKARSVMWGVASGACAGMAILTRPVLLPAVLVLLLVTATRGGLRSTIARGGTVLVFLLVQMSLNAYLYGTATMSGYGSASHMFEISGARLGANLANFGKWAVHPGLPPFWFLWPAALVVLRRDRRAWEWSAVAAASAAPYLFYLVFDNWDSSRFLLPAAVLALVLCACALSRGIGRAPSLQRWRPAIFLVLAFGCAFASQRFLQREGIEGSASLEAKYPLVGEWFRTNTPDRAVVLSSLHSGAIRMYAGRQTIRWDYIPPEALVPTIERLTAAGYEPYLALDLPSEPPMFEERFANQPIQAEPVARVRVINIYRIVSAR